jgi:hypothetical protein
MSLAPVVVALPDVTPSVDVVPTAVADALTSTGDVAIMPVYSLIAMRRFVLVVPSVTVTVSGPAVVILA